uniref:Uncharacterized protein n=1 Tax=Rhizophora mucronata TaxID=61149 RepID=A0A2P2PIB7_RHIMU
MCNILNTASCRVGNFTNTVNSAKFINVLNSFNYLSSKFFIILML